MEISEEKDDMLLDFLDGNLGKEEIARLEKELEVSGPLRLRLEELRAVHFILSNNSNGLETPSLAFTTKVMTNLHSKSYAGNSLSPKNGLLLLLGMITAAGILTIMVAAGMFDHVGGIVALDKVAPPVKNVLHQSMPSISINVKLIIKIIVGLNLVLAFFVLDRTVLKPFFQRRAGMEL